MTDLTNMQTKIERYTKKIVTLIRKAKKDYNSKINLSLANLSILAMKWWSITKFLYSNKHCSSIRVLLDEGKLISDLNKKHKSLIIILLAKLNLQILLSVKFLLCLVLLVPFLTSLLMKSRCFI